MKRDDWERQEERREFIRMLKDMPPELIEFFKGILTDMVKREALERGYFEARAAGAEFLIILN